MDRGTVMRSWGPMSCHSSTAITSCFSMIMYTIPWKLKLSQFFHGLHIHQTCHTMSMFGMLWIYMYGSVFQFPPISSNFTQSLKRSRTSFYRPQSTAWSTLWEGDVSRCMRHVAVTPETDWFSDPRPYLLIGICDQQMHFCISSHVKSIDYGLMNWFKWTDFLIWTVNQSNLWDCCMLQLYFCSLYSIFSPRAQRKTTSPKSRNPCSDGEL